MKKNLIKIAFGVLMLGILLGAMMLKWNMKAAAYEAATGRPIEWYEAAYLP